MQRLGSRRLRSRLQFVVLVRPDPVDCEWDRRGADSETWMPRSIPDGRGIQKRLDQLDFSFQPSIDKNKIRELAALAFLERKLGADGSHLLSANRGEGQ